MPRYEFRCRACGDTFEVNRPMRAANDPADCPHGHDDTVKLISMVAFDGRTSLLPGGHEPTNARCCGGECGC